MTSKEGAFLISTRWIEQVFEHYKIQKNVLVLAIQLLHRVTNNSKFKYHSKTYQLVGCVCMDLAYKYLNRAPSGIKWTRLSQDIFTSEQFIQMEFVIFRLLDFQIRISSS